MFILVKPSGVTIEDAANFKAFKIVAENIPDLARLKKMLGDLAEVENEKAAWVSESAVRQFGALTADASWQSGLTAMIEKARPHGWVSPITGAIRAHIEWTGGSDGTPS